MPSGITTGRSGAARRLDRAGMALAVASVTWTVWTGRSSLGNAVPVAALQAACVATYGAARLATRWWRPAVPLGALAVGGTLTVLRTVLPGRGPLGYANADAALDVQLAVAAAMAAVALRPRWPARAADGVAAVARRPRWPGRAAGGVAAAFVLAAAVSGSVAAVVALGLVAVLAAAAALRMPVAGIGAVAVLVVVAATAFAGVARVTGTAPGVVDRVADAVDERRVALWADAAALAHDHPVAGVGAGRFEELSPTARSDPDARWAHSDFLQQAAEGGGVALALLLAAFGWGFARLWVAGDGDWLPVLGATALTALGVHAAIDYVLRFPLLTLVGVALVGAATEYSSR
ncbi:MAG: O-antigen ligase family protein [Acidimicrobiales bacterium]